MAKTEKVDRNIDARIALAKEIMKGEPIKSFTRTLQLILIEKLDAAPLGKEPDQLYRCFITKNDSCMLGYGSSELDSVIGILKHMENMGYYFHTYVYKMSEAPELYRSGMYTNNRFNEVEEVKETKPVKDKKNKEVPPKEAKRFKQLPFL
jgi:hypothetical protein